MLLGRRLLLSHSLPLFPAFAPTFPAFAPTFPAFVPTNAAFALRNLFARDRVL